jgi:hypothetical protein
MTRHRDLVERYFQACTHEPAEQIAAFFCAHASVYDNNHKPVQGAQTIGTFYVKMRERWQGASWHIDTFIEADDAAASEWTMRAYQNGAKQLVRGSEHYEFEHGLIRQIRQYWRFDRKALATGLVDYPYTKDPRFTAC